MHFHRLRGSIFGGRTLPAETKLNKEAWPEISLEERGFIRADQPS
jgi:hypothetical protein